MSTPFSTNNPGIGGIDELTTSEEALIQALASLGTAGQVLAVTDDGTSVEWVDNSGGDAYSPGGTDVALADGGTGASLADPGADRIMFWDDSASAVAWLTVGTGLSITGTTLAATATSPAMDDISDVTITTVADNDLLAYDNATSEWINQSPAEAGFATVATSGAYGDLSGVPTIPDELTDLDTTVTGAQLNSIKTKTDHISVTQAVDLDAIETRVNALDAAVVLQGSWDASAGSFPGSGSAKAGDSYIVSTGGTVDSVVFTANDRIVAITDNASTSTYASNWLKLDYTDAVLSVAGRTGAVTIATADISDITASATELNYVDGVTSAIQTQLDSKLEEVTTSDFNASTLVTATDTIESNDNDTTIPTCAAVIDYVADNAGGGARLINTQTGTEYVLVLTDAGKHISVTNSSENELQIPPNSEVAFPIGTEIIVEQGGTGSTSIVPKPVVATTGDYLLVGGGGGGGGGSSTSGDNPGAGGGGGEVVYLTGQNIYIGDADIVVGKGGSGGTVASGGQGTAGGDSSFSYASSSSIKAKGGGYGHDDGSGGVGGSGGGAGGDTSGSGGVADPYEGSGNNGGNGVEGAGGGGGGAGGVGSNGSAGVGGNGGAGLENSISGSATYYGGGGAGGGTSANGTGGNGGGGNAGSAGTDGLGGGGGGGEGNSNYDTGKEGGDGIVIIRYLTGSITASGGTVTTDGSYTIHTFTSNGTFSVSSTDTVAINSATSVGTEINEQYGIRKMIKKAANEWLVY